MPDWISLRNLLEYLEKTPIWFLVALAFFPAVILYIPENLAKLIFVDTFRNEYRIFLGPFFLLALLFLIARLLQCFGTHIKEHIAKKKRKQVRQNYLRELMPEEKGYLLPYIAEEKSIIYFEFTDGIIGGLKFKNIVFRSTDYYEAHAVPYGLQPWARRYLNRNPKLLHGHKGQPPSQ